MHSKQWLTDVFLFFVCFTSVVCLKKDRYYCVLSGSCTCVTVNYDRNIDLGGVNLTQAIVGDEWLIYHPCQSSNEIVIESRNETSNSTMQLDTFTNVKVDISNAAVTLIYTNVNETEEFDVVLVCEPLAVSGNESLTSVKNVTANQRKIELKTSQVCGLNLSDAYDDNPESESWTYFFSFMLVVAFVYFVGGSVINACLFNEIGINMIPHHDFWCSLYNRIKDKICGGSAMATAYESI